MEGLSGAENAGGPVGMVNAVGIMLGFQAECCAVGVFLTALSCSGTGEIGGIELYTGLIGEDGHDDPGLVAHGHCRRRSADNIIRVVTTAALHTGLLGVDPISDGVHGAEVHGSTFYGNNVTGGQAGFVSQMEGLCMDLHPVSVDAAGAVAVEIEVAVVGQIQNGVLITFGLVTQLQSVALPGHGDGYLQIAGIAFLPMGGQAGEHHGVTFLAAAPYDPVKADLAAVDMVGAVVGAERIGLSVQIKRSAGNTIGKASNGGAKATVMGGVFIQGIVTEHHVHRLAIPVRHEDGPDGHAVVQYLSLQTGAIGQSPAKYLCAVRQSSKGLFFDHDDLAPFRCEVFRIEKKSAMPHNIADFKHVAESVGFEPTCGCPQTDFEGC